MKTLVKKLPVFILLFFLLCTVCLAPTGKAAYAAETSPGSYDETDVLSDLEGSTLNGKPFDKDDYAQSDIRDPQIISFVEYGYSFYTNRQDDFGLYIYVYNPHAVAFDNDETRNQILLQAGENAADKYDLHFLAYSDEPGYEGLFYKFKLALTEDERQAILYGLNRASRVYNVTELELVSRGSVQMYPCTTTYTFTGFAKGYGSELAADESTLTCSVDGFEEYVGLDVHQTVYRPKGDFLDKDEEGGQLLDGNQPQLNSCYFRVPRKYFTQYGELTKTVAQWYEYMTQPIFVTTDINIYRQLSGLHGRNLQEFDPSDETGIMIQSWGNEYYIDPAQWRKTPFHWASNVDEFDGWYYKYYAADAYGLYWPGGQIEKEAWLNERFENLAGVIYAGTGSEYFNVSVSAERVKAELISNSEALGGPYYAGRYSQALFTDYIDDADHKFGYNREEIELKKNATIMWNETTVKGLGYFGIGSLGSDSFGFNVQKGITVTESDLKGNDEEIAESLYIAQGDVADLKSEFQKAAKNDEELVLLRYAVTNYHSAKAIAMVKDLSNVKDQDKDDTLMHAWMDDYHNGRINGYLAQETVFLDFDIISLWFETIDAKTEIPVMMAPQDVINGLQPGVAEDPNMSGANGLPWYIWFAIILILIIAVIVLAVLFPAIRPILNLIMKGLVWLIAAPFRLIGWIAKQIALSIEERRKRKTKGKQAPPKQEQKKPPAKPKENTQNPEETTGDKAQGASKKSRGKKTAAKKKSAKKKPVSKKSPGKKTAAKKKPASKKVHHGAKHDK